MISKLLTELQAKDPSIRTTVLLADRAYMLESGDRSVQCHLTDGNFEFMFGIRSPTEQNQKYKGHGATRSTEGAFKAILDWLSGTDWEEVLWGHVCVEPNRKELFGYWNQHVATVPGLRTLWIQPIRTNLHRVEFSAHSGRRRLAYRGSHPTVTSTLLDNGLHEATFVGPMLSADACADWLLNGKSIPQLVQEHQLKPKPTVSVSPELADRWHGSWAAVDRHLEIATRHAPEARELVSDWASRFGSTLRAGKTFYGWLVLSRSIEHGLETFQPFVELSFHHNVVVIRSWMPSLDSTQTFTYNESAAILERLYRLQSYPPS